ncbi:hypothetical protein B0H14DRAFT_2919207 [Mycena olivaceomarginata]|nr:hypothetical protein B0H14DRAFT_2919207 [Mycena olivaceomarginata]
MPKVKQVRRKPACLRCNEKKVGCNRASPCDQCQKHNMECAYPDAGIPSRRRSCSDKGQVIQSTKNMQIVLESLQAGIVNVRQRIEILENTLRVCSQVPCGGDLVGSSSVGFDASWDSPSPGVPIGRWEYASQIFPPPSQRFYDESWGPA